ncbi:ERCC4 domain-containing protein [Pseudoalteromonas arctica]|uniref:Multidrug MFS transporter n=1 Tax=Pseudoalteromonas arctica TaxID=394751 RepID=A0A7Y0HBE5_9GAMM|nr:ERCC4 domain-containing protein [Pseudoalteromonas arctica]NMM39787.1 multidrug MFS transporter [Pseudoalteromonas arctica]
MDSIRIIADDRERRSNTLSVLEQRTDILLTVERLTVGDYFINSWLLIERKQVCDLVDSLISGRLFNQANRLANSGFKTAILIEGNARDIANYKIHRHSILGALVTLTIVFGISILRAADSRESVALMVFAAQQQAKQCKLDLPRFGRRSKTAKARKIYILQGLPSVGPVLAKRLLAHFGSVKGVLSADVDALRGVEGVGKEIATKIVAVIS